MIDVSFNLLTFFVMLLSISKDEAAQVLRLPSAKSASILADDQTPNAISINVAYLDGPDGKHPTLMAWGEKFNLDDDGDRKLLAAKAKRQADIEKDTQPAWQKQGLSTTIV